jgi:type VI secretion system secreted protein VgrG
MSRAWVLALSHRNKPLFYKDRQMPETQYSQEDRLLSIKTTLGETELLLKRFAGTEAVSTPFEFRVTLLSPNKAVDLKSLLRTPATVSLVLADGTERPFNAVFRSFRQAEDVDVSRERRDMGISNPASDLAVYEAVLVPEVWFLSLKSDCRIFQTMSVVDIVSQVLKDASVDFEFHVNGAYPKRDYCVQYRESSLNFISRLLEEEGIFYFFQHTAAKHTMVFADQSSMQAPCPGQETASYAFSRSGWVGEDEEGITNVERLEQAHTGQAELRDYNFETPNVNLNAVLSGDNEEDYDYPGKYGEKEEGNRYVRIRLEERETEQFVLRGTSHCRAFRPGYNFKLKEHFRKDTNQEYFLTSVTHDAMDATYRQGGEDEAHRYANSFAAIPKTVPYRPARLARKPVVQGPQPALVVGKAGEEIWVDKYGRVKVQFYWDRQGKKNETSSCWVRVSQVWAGKNWGWVTIPRIGQEVIVDFLEGDPDRPVITGRIYNADQTPPYTLPANQTQSGIKSRSSKGGEVDNFNEIRFEDLKGSEMITVHAEKDMETTVEHDDAQTVQNNRTITVDGTHTETICKNTTITIKEGNHSLTLNKGNQSITLSMGNQTTKLDLGAVSTEAMQSITLTVGSSSIKIDQMGVTIQGMMIKINGEMMTQIQAGVMLTAKGAITMIN